MTIRVPMRMLLSRVQVLTLAFLIGFIVPGCSQDPPSTPGGEAGVVEAPPAEFSASAHSKLWIGPIPGLTNGWHPVQGTLVLPMNTVVEFMYEAPEDYSVGWSGAEFAFRDAVGSYALCPTGDAGYLIVSTTVISPSGQTATTKRRFSVISAPVIPPRAHAVSVSADLLHLESTLANHDTQAAYFGGSIARVDQLGPGHYMTSVGKHIRLHAEIDHPYADLLEWTVNGEPAYLGPSPILNLDEVGTFTIRPGSDPASPTVQLTTYRTTITSHVSGRDIVDDGVRVTFHATTEPRGYEHLVTWLSSTTYGKAVPASGTGPSFTVMFEDTWSRDDGQWLGVKADNALFNQDQKMLPPQCISGCCGGGGGDVTYGNEIAVNADLHLWDENCKAGGHENVGELIQAICDAYDAAGQQISVFVDGHGAPGVMSTGGGTTPGSDAQDNSADMLTSNNAAWFADQIKNKVTRITLFGCEVGADQGFLDGMASAELEVKAYDQKVCTNSALTKHWPTEGATLKCGN